MRNNPIEIQRQITNTWLDWVSGASVRQGLPAKIERIA